MENALNGPKHWFCRSAQDVPAYIFNLIVQILQNLEFNIISIYLDTTGDTILPKCIDIIVSLAVFLLS